MSRYEVSYSIVSVVDGHMRPVISSTLEVSADTHAGASSEAIELLTLALEDMGSRIPEPRVRTHGARLISEETT